MGAVNKIRNLLFAACAFAAMTAWAQSEKPVVSARVTPDSIMIGDRFTLEMEVDKEVTQTIEFPSFGAEEKPGGPEMVAELPADTLGRDGKRVRILKKYIMTVFDEGGYSLGRLPLLYVDKNIVDTLYTSDSLHLWVDTFVIDTTAQKIHDIKPPIHTPVRFGEFSGYLFHAILLMQLVIGLIYVLVKVHGRRKGRERVVPKRTEPAHVTAIRELEKLDAEKLWQNDRHKMYYTRLTDIVREYLERRYGIPAMEMTSDEINDALRELSPGERPMIHIRRLLSTADYVKFAKYIPDAGDNEMSYHDAWYFVEETKPSAAPADEGGDGQSTGEE